MPRFVMFVRASADSEGDVKPAPEDLERMSAYNSSLVDAGILHFAEGLLPSSQDSYRIDFHNSGAPTVQPGPFPHTELVCGMWVIKVKDAAEALLWAQKCPFIEGGTIELRRIADLEDFGDACSPEVRAKEEEIRKKVSSLAKGESE